MIASRRVAFAVLLAAFAGCLAPVGRPPTPAAAGIAPAELTDPHGYGDSPGLPVARDLFRAGERIRLAQRPAVVPAKKTCLALSGGGA